MTPIFAPENEIEAWQKAMLRGETYEFKTKGISDYPSNFKEWITKNKDNINAATERGKAPYFIAHNKTAINGLLNSKAADKPSIKERAAARHAARTDEQKAAIQKAWTERRNRIEHENSNVQEQINDLKAMNVPYRDVQLLPKKLTSDEIIAKLSGGDETRGSCSSLAFAYAANRCGFDVTDFRGGISRSYFSKTRNIKDIAKAVGGKIFYDHSDINSFNTNIIQNVEEGKEYYYGVGRHAAIIRKTNGKMEYLELQSRYKKRNTFHPLNTIALLWRFGAKRSYELTGGVKYSTASILTEVGLFKGDAGFRQLMGYINTAENEQMKGARGNIK